MSIRPVLALGLLTAAVAACAPAPGPVGALQPSAFSEADFAWSANDGAAAINGQVDYRQDSKTYACVGSVGLTPDTPYTRARFRTLYGSTDRAVVPAAVVRARDIPDPNANYRSYVRSTACVEGRFSFTGLPDGGWFVIAPVTSGGEPPLVLMRHVDTRGGRAVSVTL